jgi:hypothetical protein
MGVIVEALVQMVVGAWTEGLRGQARRVTIAILVLAPIITLALVHLLSR